MGVNLSCLSEANPKKNLSGLKDRIALYCCMFRFFLFDVAKCNLGKVRLKPMQSAVLFGAVRDLQGGP